jgi:hypothetical protein
MRMIALISAKMARISASDSGLSQTTTRLGVFEEARTSPHAPLSRITRAPLTVTISLIARLAINSPASHLATSLATKRSSVSYFINSGSEANRPVDFTSATIVELG